MSATTTSNGRPRKQLSDELDRLGEQLDRADGILDALAEGLNGAVRDASREGTRQAVKDAVIELLTDPALRTALHTASAPPQPDRPSAWDRLKSAARHAAVRVKQVIGSAATAVVARAARASAAVGRVVARVRASALVGTAVTVLVATGAVVAVVRAGVARRVIDLVGWLRGSMAGAVSAAAGWAHRTAWRPLLN